jgi:hypothetical protein
VPYNLVGFHFSTLFEGDDKLFESLKGEKRLPDSHQMIDSVISLVQKHFKVALHLKRHIVSFWLDLHMSLHSIEQVK